MGRTGAGGLMGCSELDATIDRFESEGRTAVLAGWDGPVRGVLAVADTVKDDAAPPSASCRPLESRS